MTPDRALDVVDSAFRAAEARDWQALFNVLDPAAIEQFKQQQRPMVVMSTDLSALGEQDEGGMLRGVFGVPDLAAFDTLPAALVLRRWLVVSHGTHDTRPAMTQMRRAIGHVLESPDVAHVVFREQWVGPMPREAVRVISVRRVDGHWRVGLGGGLVSDETGGVGIGYNPGSVDPTLGEADFVAPDTEQ
ncbi:MAG: hypothetical protein ABIT20_07360 [Gemmatimonadaceae bacterium]